MHEETLVRHAPTMAAVEALAAVLGVVAGAAAQTAATIDPLPWR
jgi:hypothetical protein